MASADLSIGIVSYHNSKDISRLVESIEHYTSPQLKKRIYIVDNADDQALFEPLTARYDDVEYVHAGGNIGFGAGHNLLLNKIDSKYHAIVNPDVLLTEDSFSILLKFLDEHNCAMAVPKLVGEDGNRLSVYRQHPTLIDMMARMSPADLFKERNAKHELAHADYTKPFNVPFAQGSFLVCETGMLKKLKGFDERFFMYLEDADLCRRVNQVSSVMYCPDTTVIHKWEKGSHKSLKLFSIHMSSWFKYFSKWGWFAPGKSYKEQR
ncbi:MAG: glycosyltransferase family 2 protein [Ileibacterium sp.]|nr:glycosyltransferase family 2 protein [Ileibacterium sp.]